MKIKYNFLSPLLMAILTICCLWIVTDVAYGVRMWELGVDAWIGRIKALAIILIGVSLSYLFFNYLANIFLIGVKSGGPARCSGNIYGWSCLI